MANLVFDFLHHYQTGERRASDPADAYQYDEGHVMEAVVPVAVTSCEIHYWVRGQEDAEAYVPESITQNEDGSYSIIGHIPNTYFETYGELRVYIVVTDGTASITTYEGYVHICQRSMPDDYVDDDPENEATRVLTEAQEAAATATAAAETCEEVLESIPEDYSTLSDDVSDLKDGITELYKQELTLTRDSSGEEVGKYSFVAGNKYVITNSGSSNIVAYSKLAQTGDELESFGTITSGNSKTVTAQYNANYFRAYFGSSSTVTIKCLNSAQELSKEDAEIEENVNFVLSGVDAIPVWENGTINLQTGVMSYSSTAVRSNLLHILAGSKVNKNASGFNLYAVYYSSYDGSFVSASTIIDSATIGEFEFRSDCYVRFLLSAGDVIAPSYAQEKIDTYLVCADKFYKPSATVSFLGYASYLGNAILVKFLNSKTLLVDSFSSNAWSNLNTDLHNRGVRHLDYFMLTHWHSDHCGNIQNLINNGYIDSNTVVYLPQALDTSATAPLPSDWSTVVSAESTNTTAITNAGITPVYPTEGQIVDFGGCYIKFWNADHSSFYSDGAYASTNYNDWSLCANFYVGNKSVCFSADIGSEAQKKMVALGTVTMANILTAPHHGWQNGNVSDYFGLIPDWINAVRPEVVFSEDYSEHQSYINTVQSATQTWCEKNGVPNYRTYDNGSMDVYVGADSWKLLGAYTSYIRGDCNWFYTYGDNIKETKMAYLKTSLLKQNFATTSTANLLRNAIVAMLGSDYNTSAYKFTFKVRVIDTGSSNNYLEYYVTNFIPETASGTYQPIRSASIFWNAYNSQGTISLTGVTGTPQIVVELIEYSAVS